jgi:hypothetical protein
VGRKKAEKYGEAFISSFKGDIRPRKKIKEGHRA